MRRWSAAPTALGASFVLGVVVGGVQWLNSRNDPVVAGGQVGVANSIHLVLALAVAAALVGAARRHRTSVIRFAVWPFSRDGWHRLLAATAAIPLSLWRLLRNLARRRVSTHDVAGLPAAVVLFLAAAIIWYVPFRDGVQVLAGLSPNFTREAWGGPSYVGAALAHWFDGALMFYAAAAVVRLLSRWDRPGVADTAPSGPVPRVAAGSERGSRPMTLEQASRRWPGDVLTDT